MLSIRYEVSGGIFLFLRQFPMPSKPDYEALFRASPYPYMLLDPQLNIIDANPAYLTVTGAAAADVIGRPVFEAFPENADDPESTNVALTRASMERALATREPDAMPFVRFSMARRGPDGAVAFEERYWSSVHTPVLDQHGEVAFIAQNSLDVTDFYRLDHRSRVLSPEAGPALEAYDPGSQARMHEAMRRAVMGERSHLHNLFNQAPGFVAVLTGREHVFEMVNEAYYQLVGHRPIVGKRVWEALPEVRGQGFEQLLDEVFESGKPFVGRGIKLFVQRESGGAQAEAYVDFLYHPLFGKDGKVNGIFVQGHDVTETHLAQNARRDSDARLAEGLVAARMVVWDFDLINDAMVVSDNAEQVLGQRGTDTAALAAAVPEDDLARLRASRQRAMAGNGSYAETVRYLRPDNGRQVWLDVRGNVQYDADGHPVAVRGVTLDVTERVRAEEDLRDAHRRKDEFLAMLAHELRNPLAPISSAAQLLRHGRLDGERRDHATDIIIRQVRHVSGLLDDLIDVSRVTRGLISTEKKPCVLQAIVADAVEQVRPNIEAHRQRLELTLPATPLRILGDHKRVVQVLANLLGNASKYTQPGGAIGLALERSGETVELRVSDNGIGIAPQLLPRVFDLFAQGERSADRSQGGLGVGLAVVRSLVELHGGQVTAASTGAGHGSVFTVALPLLPGHDSAPAAAPGVDGQSGAGAPLRLLVVDDNPDAAQMMALLLEAAGYRVAAEATSHAALRRIEAERPDVCLLDIGLPDLDGYQLARRIRELPGMAGSLLVAVTGYGQEADRIKALAAGFDHHLVKPVDTAQLSALLADWALAAPAAIAAAGAGRGV
jgi:PAS domain S-box-containing protein